MKETMINKFDNVTYRTIQKKSRLQNGEFERFLLSFEKAEF
jgi:hypothetical protein